jgi:hypothetical protein
VDFDAKDEADAKYVAYSASRLYERMDLAGARLNILILDACRNNPFRSTRSGDGGLAAMSTGRGTLIAFATAPGKTADDNPSGRNGLFTSHLISALREPGLSLDQVFNRVREKVYSESNQRQLPWTVSSVIGEFYFQSAGSGQPERPRNPLSQGNAPANPLARPKPAADPPPVTEAPKANPAELAKNARSAYDRGDLQEAIRLSNETLRIAPANAEGLFVLAAVRFKNLEYDLFETTAVQGLAAGAVFPFLLGHHHTLTGGHHAALKIGGGKIAFDPGTGTACNQKAFEVPIANIIEIKNQTSDQGEIFLNIRIRDAENRVRVFNFADPDSTLDKSSGLPRIVSPPKAQRMLLAVANVLKAASK